MNLGRPLKIAHVITRLCQGGATNVLSTLAKSVDSSRYEYHVIYGNLSSNEPDASFLIRDIVSSCTLVPSLQREFRPLSDFSAGHKIKAQLESIAPDVVHTHTSKAGFLGRRAARDLGLPCVHSTHGNIFMPHANIPGVSGWKKTIFSCLEKKAAKWAQKIFTLSVAEIEQYVAMGFAQHDHYQALPSPVELELFSRNCGRRNELRKERNVDLDLPITIHVGRLAEEKGHLDLLEAFSRDVPGELWIVGEGPLRQQIESKVLELNLGARVRLLGHSENLSDWLPLVDVLCLPSSYEGQGLVLVEAQASGVPVVATRVGGIPEVVQDGVNGLLVPPRDPAALASMLNRVHGDRNLRKSLVDGGLKSAPRYSPAQVHAQLNVAYQEVLGNSR